MQTAESFIPRFDTPALRSVHERANAVKPRVRWTMGTPELRVHIGPPSPVYRSAQGVTLMRAGVLTDKGKGRPLPAPPLELTPELCAQVQADLDRGNVQELDPRAVAAYIEQRTKEQGVLAWLKRCEEFSASYEEEVDEEQAAEDAQHAAQRLAIHKEMHGHRREFAPIPVEAVMLPTGLAAPEPEPPQSPRQRTRGVLKVLGHRFVGLLDARTRKALTPRQHELLDADMLQLQYMGEA